VKTFIANFGRHNYLWPTCLARSSVATFEDEDMWPLWQAGEKEAYIARCIALKKTVRGLTPTPAVASRWFNLAHIITATENDLWIHRQKDELWWTISGEREVVVENEASFEPDVADNRIYVLHKETAAWSKQNKQGNPLDWRALHAKAREFLFTEGTINQLSDDHAAYAAALIEGRDLSFWHTQPAWKAKAESARKGPITIFSAKQRAAARMAGMAKATAAAARGQEVLRTVKNKDLRFVDQREFEAFVLALIEAQEGLCAITDLPLQFDGEHTDIELLCSLDRIDSDGDYEDGSLQVVCRFVNRWKGSDKDLLFRRLIAVLRSDGGGI
jgi:hypothetical protein